MNIFSVGEEEKRQPSMVEELQGVEDPGEGFWEEIRWYVNDDLASKLDKQYLPQISDLMTLLHIIYYLSQSPLHIQPHGTYYK